MIALPIIPALKKVKKANKIEVKATKYPNADFTIAIVYLPNKMFFYTKNKPDTLMIDFANILPQRVEPNIKAAYKNKFLASSALTPIPVPLI